MSTVDTQMSRVDRRLSFGQMGVHANISSIDSPHEILIAWKYEETTHINL